MITMRLLLTNDDGYGEPGLLCLQEATKRIGDQVVIAPDEPHSCCGHRVSMWTPLAIKEHTSDSYSLGGTPADCVRLGVKRIAGKTDWVIAGINPGANLGSDVYQSGTVAAAREAAILGYKGIAISHYIAKEESIDWSHTEKIVAELLTDITARNLAKGKYLNINLPSPLPLHAHGNVVHCPCDKQPHLYTFTEDEGVFRYMGVIHDRPYAPGSDVDVCFSGKISITTLTL